MGRPWLNVSLADYEGHRPDALSLEVGGNPLNAESASRRSHRPGFRNRVLLVGHEEIEQVSDSGCETALSDRTGRRCGTETSLWNEVRKRHLHKAAIAADQSP